MKLIEQVQGFLQDAKDWRAPQTRAYLMTGDVVEKLSRAVLLNCRNVQSGQPF